MFDTPPAAQTQTRHHVRPGDIDAWGHLNHAKAIELLELGRYDWITARGGRGAYGCLPVVIRLDVSYRREIFLSDVLITTELKATKHYSAEFLQTIVPADDGVDAAIVGRIWLSFLAADTRRPLRINALPLLRDAMVPA